MFGIGDLILFMQASLLCGSELPSSLDSSFWRGGRSWFNLEDSGEFRAELINEFFLDLEIEFDLDLDCEAESSVKSQQNKFWPVDIHTYTSPCQNF